MNRVSFIKTEQLTQYGFVHANVEEDIILNALYRVQDTQIQPVLGTPLFKKIIDMIKAGNVPEPYYSLMVEKIIPALVPLVEIKLTFHLTSEIENKGVGSNNDEYMRSNSVEQNNNLRNEIWKDARHYLNQLTKHLCDDNGELYPEYTERTSKSEDMSPSGSSGSYMDKISII